MTPCHHCGAPTDAGPGADGRTRCDDCAAETAPPWAIEIRDPEVHAADGHVDPPATTRALAVLALGVAALAGTLVLGSRLLVDDEPLATGAAPDADVDELATDGSTTTSAPTTTRPTTTSSPTTTGPTTTGPTATTGPTTTAPATTGPTTSDRTGTRGATTTAPATTTGATTGSGSSEGSTGRVPALRDDFAGGWVAQLTSVPTSAGTARLEQAWDDVRGEVPDAVAATSDEWDSLRDGYWVLVDDGPFASSDDVRAFCAGVAVECLPRELQGRR